MEVYVPLWTATLDSLRHATVWQVMWLCYCHVTLLIIDQAFVDFFLAIHDCINCSMFIQYLCAILFWNFFTVNSVQYFFTLIIITYCINEFNILWARTDIFLFLFFFLLLLLFKFSFNEKVKSKSAIWIP